MYDADISFRWARAIQCGYLYKDNAMWEGHDDDGDDGTGGEVL